MSPVNRTNIIPARILHLYPKRIPPVLDRGIVFSVFYPNNCAGQRTYLTQAVTNALHIKNMDPTVLFATLKLSHRQMLQ